MSSFDVFVSNQQTALYKVLEDVLNPPLANPFAPEMIAVSGDAMADWLKAALAKSKGISANIQFKTTDEILWDRFREQDQSLPQDSPYQLDSLTWVILSLFKNEADLAPFKTLSGYLEAHSSESKRSPLAEKSATALLKYMYHRPEMLREWEKTAPVHWQAYLWQEIVKQLGEISPLHLYEKGLLSRSALSVNGFPERLNFFSLSHFSPLQLDLMQGLSQSCPLAVFLWAPSPAIEVKKIAENPFLNGFTQGSQALLNNLEKREGISLHYLTEVSPADHLLGAVKQALWENNTDYKHPSDESLSVHSVHHPYRELEALKQYLLSCFRDDPTLRPNQVLVGSHQIQAYAPYLDAVFKSEPVLPARFASVSQTHFKPLYQSFRALLSLSEGRFGLSDILDLIEQPLVSQKLLLGPEDVVRCKDWLQDVNIKWGMNTEHRKRLHAEPFSENTWEKGFERLLLGYGLPEQSESLFMGILPYHEIEGALAQQLGRVIDYIQTLFQTLKTLSKPRPLSEWAPVLKQLPERFFSLYHDEMADLYGLYEIIDALGEQAVYYPHPVSLSFVKSHISKSLGAQTHFLGFLGQITFGKLDELRGVPARITCVLGLNEGGFPRQNRSFDFDLMSESQTDLDPSQSQQDRGLFFEWLGMAQDKVYISFMGQSARDNRVFPPSIALSEYLEHIGQVTGQGHRVIQHPLHPFDPRYFDPNSLLVNYQALDFRMAQNQSLINYSPLFLADEVGGNSLSEFVFEIGPQDVLRFYQNPCRWYLQRHLGVYYSPLPETQDDNEKFSLTGLDRYALQAEILERLQGNDSLLGIKAMKKAEQALPVGHIGDSVFDALGEPVEGYYRSLSAQMVLQTETRSVDFTHQNLKLSGDLTCQEGGLIAYRFGKLSARFQLAHWIQHLLLNLEQAPADQITTKLYGYDLKKNKILTLIFSPLNDAEVHLKVLADVFMQGQIEPVLFFPDSALAWAENIDAGPSEAWKKAKSEWLKTGFGDSFGEGLNPYIERCTRHQDPFGSDFQDLATAIFEPMISARLMG